MKITELKGDKRSGEFEGPIEIEFQGEPPSWITVNTLKEAYLFYTKHTYGEPKVVDLKKMEEVTKRMINQDGKFPQSDV